MKTIEQVFQTEAAIELPTVPETNLTPVNEPDSKSLIVELLRLILWFAQLERQTVTNPVEEK